MSKVNSVESGCDVWIGALSTKGYGQFWINGRQTQAHRWAYENLRGPIPEGLEIDHLCHNPACVRVDHLEPVTHAENLRRRRPFAKAASSGEGA